MSKPRKADKIILLSIIKNWEVTSTIHYMRLKEEPFEKIRNGDKTIELRLWDEKRRKLNLGDEIEFSSLSDESKKIKTKVTHLHLFDNFEKLYESLPLENCGYTKGSATTASATDMNAYYSLEEQALYGVVGIEFEIVF